jgi:hypothetical protein
MQNVIAKIVNFMQYVYIRWLLTGKMLTYVAS